MLVLNAARVRELLTMPDCINILEDAYRDLHTGSALTRRRSDCLVPKNRAESGRRDCGIF